MSEEQYDPRTPLEIRFELHEALALCVFYEEAPDNLDLVEDGIDFGGSVDLAMLRIGEALSKFMGNKEMRLRAGAIRAAIDQERGPL